MTSCVVAGHIVCQEGMYTACLNVDRFSLCRRKCRMQTGRHIRLCNRTSCVLTVSPQDVDRWRLQRFLQVSSLYMVGQNTPYTWWARTQSAFYIYWFISSLIAVFIYFWYVNYMLPIYISVYVIIMYRSKYIILLCKPNSAPLSVRKRPGRMSKSDSMNCFYLQYHLVVYTALWCEQRISKLDVIRLNISPVVFVT